MIGKDMSALKLILQIICAPNDVSRKVINQRSKHKSQIVGRLKTIE